MKKPTVYFDLDGVLANFDKAAESILGTDNIYKFEFVYGPEAFWNALNHSGDFFEKLEPTSGAKRMLDAARGYPTGIITALPKTKQDLVRLQKKAWVATHLSPELPVICCRTHEKPEFCAPGDIMIDDRALNKKAWEAKGGRYIIHTCPQNTISQLASFLNGHSARVWPVCHITKEELAGEYPVLKTPNAKDKE